MILSTPNVILLKKAPHKKLLSLINHDFKRTILANFRNDLLYSFFAGKVAHGAQQTQSDIDCIVVLKETALNNSTTKERVKKFVDDYLRIHAAYGFLPDLDFPGDVITKLQKEEAIAGRGFCLKDKFHCPLIRTNKDWDKENVDYRIWLTEIAFNNNHLIAGNKTLFQEDSSRAVDTIVKFLLINYNGKIRSNILVQMIKDRGKPFLGFSKNYGDLDNYIEEKIRQSLYRLLQVGFIAQNRVDNQFIVVNKKLDEWQKQLIARSTVVISYPISWEELRNYVRQKLQH